MSVPLGRICKLIVLEAIIRSWLVGSRGVINVSKFKGCKDPREKLQCGFSLTRNSHHAQEECASSKISHEVESAPYLASQVPIVGK